VTLLVGPLGSGKSELCEEWFQAAIDRYVAHEGAPCPIWIHASELITNSLETLLASRMTLQEVGQRGVALVVDGLDEVDVLVANRIVSQAIPSRVIQGIGGLIGRAGLLKDSNGPGFSASTGSQLDCYPC
jgi:hypothetical protein